jgi:hypothetical protein
MKSLNGTLMSLKWDIYAWIGCISVNELASNLNLQQHIEELNQLLAKI